MNRFFAILFLIISGHLSGQPTDYIAHYPFDGNANDASANTNDGTITGATLTSDRFGVANKALQFSGAQTNVSLNGGAGINIDGDHTVNLWVKRSGEKNDIIKGTQGELWFIDPAGLAMEFYDGITLEYQHYYFHNVPLDDWFMLTFIWENRGFTAYVNGIKLTNDAPFGSSDPIPDPINISTFTGESVLDDIKIYNRALNIDEITELLAEGDYGLVAYYPFNGNANDESGNGFHGTVSGATLSTDRFGNADQAYDFDGTDDHIDIGTSEMLNGENEATISVLFKADDLTRDQSILQIRESFLKISSVGNDQILGDIFIDEVFNTVGSSVAQDVWNNALLRYTGTKLELFINGTLEDETTIAGTIGLATSNISTIGAVEAAGLMDFFNGKIDEIRIYDRALSDQEISNLNVSLSTETDFLTFSLPVQTEAAVINASSHTIGIDVLEGTDLTSLTASFTLSNGASATVNTVAQTSGVTSNNFSNPVVYQVTAEDGSTIQNWTVTVSVVSQFVDAVGTFFSIESNSSVEAADYDNDGDYDLLVTGTVGGSEVLGKTVLYDNNGDGTFSPASYTDFINVYRSSVAWSDFNNDGLLDVIVTGNTGNETTNIGQTVLYRNVGSGNFTQALQGQIVDVREGDVAWGDFNNDGWTDIMIIGVETNGGIRNRLYRNDEGGVFTNTESFESSKRILDGSVEWSDYDNDDDLDLYISGASSGTYVSELYENSSGVLSEVLDETFGGTFNSEVEVADPDNDGDEDVLFAGLLNDFTTSTQVYINNSGTAFNSLTPNPFEPFWDGSAAWGDLNNDGNSDLMITGRLQSDAPHTSLYVGDGAGSFSLFADGDLPNAKLGSIRPFDFDGDGDLDIVLTGGNTWLYKNNEVKRNTPPPIPSNLSVNIISETVNLAWDQANDQETPANGLTYDLYLTDLTTAEMLIAPLSDTASGFRRVPQKGQIKNNRWVYMKNLSNGDYRFGVQSIDNSFAGSEFATKVFSIAAGTNHNTNILSYSLNEQIGNTIYDYKNHTISVEVQEGTNLTNLIASFRLSPGALASIDGTQQTSGVTTNDFTNPVTYQVTAQTGSTTQNWTIFITIDGVPINNPLTSLNLSNTSLNGSVSSGVLFGTLSTESNNADDTFTYSLVFGEGDTDNIKFSISGNSLLTAAEINELSSIRIQSSNGTFTISKAFDIEIKNVAVSTILNRGNAIEDYRIFGVPTNSIRVDQVFPDLQAIDQGTSWRIISYVNGDLSDLERASELSGGVGYWHINSKENQPNITSMVPIDLNSNFEFELPLNSGWNLISNPFLEELNWSDVISYNLSQGVISDGDITPDGVYTYNGAYNVSTSLGVFEGGWVSSTEGVTLRLPNPSASSSGRKSTSGKFSIEDSWVIDEANWQLILHQKAGYLSSNLSGIGMRQGAKDQVDHFDLLSPPNLSEEINFGLRDNYGLSRNYVSPGTSKEWEFQVTSNHDEAILSWDTSVVARLPRNLYLYVPHLDRSYNMKAISELSFQSGRTLKVIYGDEIDHGTLDLQAKAYPNPADQEVTIQFFVDGPSESYEASAIVYGIDGKLVYKKTEEKISNAMASVRLEDLDLPAGLYLYQVTYGYRKSPMKKLIIR